MRALFFCTPGAGHLLPLLPLIRAFKGRGDDVAVCTAESMESSLKAEGVDLISAGVPVEALVAEVLRTTGVDLFQGVTVEAEAEFFTGARIDLGFDEAAAKARAWQPDLIVAEHFDFVGPLVGAVLGVPVASLAYGPAIQPVSVEPIAKRLRGRYEERGVTYGSERWYLDTCPPALQNAGWEAPGNRIGLRPEAFRNSGEAPQPKSEGDNARPRVLVSFGTAYALPHVIGPLLAELLTQDIDVRATLNTSSPQDFGLTDEQIARVEFVGFTPLVDLLQDVDVMLTHGGAGTVLGALAEGVPLVVTPLGADQPIQAERVAAAGAGISFPLLDAPVESVLKAVNEVLTDTSYADKARLVGRQIAEMNSPADVAEQLAAAVAV
ncbi:glycosyltransferase [Streptomyces sp. NPDC001822]|uniref:glycosyltransferase n=1 Tax=Streptomyces sp. NPDC001822 TaxID=3364614 RepID=UPI0036831340